jgi:hypothetical protein
MLQNPISDMQNISHDRKIVVHGYEATFSPNLQKKKKININ